MKLPFLVVLLSSIVTVHAQLIAAVSPPKMIGQKVIVTMALTNQLAVKVESARAVCFILDSQGKLVSQSTKWVIGGSKDRLPLPPASGTTFNFVITRPTLTSGTNLTANVAFDRVLIPGGSSADIRHQVVVIPADK